MSLCLENATDDDVLPAAEALTSDDGVKASIAAPSGKGRVLLIEDDASFNEVTRDYLAECGYTVVAVQSGAEGVKEVLASDFTLILCDMMMPTLPGDMFYRAVERIRPQLCRRFVFMTGYRDDDRTSEFIKKVGAYVLRKPFPLKHLVDLIALIEVLNDFQSVFDGPPGAPDVSRLLRTEDGLPAGPTPRPQASAVAKFLAPLKNAAPDPYYVPGSESDEPPREALLSQRDGVVPREFCPTPVAVTICPAHLPESAPPAAEPWRKHARSICGTLLWMVLLMAVAAIPAGRYFDLRAREAASSSQLLICEQQWAITSARLQQAEGKRRESEGAVNRAKRIAGEYQAPGLEQALRSVTTAASTNVELQGIQVRGEGDAPAAFHLRITGVCTGQEPRRTADRFRGMLEVNLKQFFAREGVTTRFERLEEAPPSSSEPFDQQKREAAFTVIATTGSDGLRGMERSEKR